MTERLQRKLATWLAKGKGGPTGARAGSLESRKDLERLVLIIEEERAHGTLPDRLDLRRHLVGVLGISLRNADAICELFGRLALHTRSGR